MKCKCTEALSDIVIGVVDEASVNFTLDLIIEGDASVQTASVSAKMVHQAERGR